MNIMNEEFEISFKKFENEGFLVKRISKEKIHIPMPVILEEKQYLCYAKKPGFGCKKEDIKRVNIEKLIEIRQGYSTDRLQKLANKKKFRIMAPENCCFSIVLRRGRKFKTIDFATKYPHQAEQCVILLRYLITNFKKHNMTYCEKKWLLKNYRLADRNRNGEVSFDELCNLLINLNLVIRKDYVKKLFKELVQKNGKRHDALNEKEFIQLFEKLEDLTEYRKALIGINGKGEESLDVEQLMEFLTKTQKFQNIDFSKVESIIRTFEPTLDVSDDKKLVLSINGFKRLLQSRYGNILKENHENVFQDMDQPLCNYFIFSTHNTYLTDLQFTGHASVEGYIAALKQGARLLELDLFDGEDGEPVITHKNTFISTISLRNALNAIKEYAFKTSPYPVILTLENHVIEQQITMADIFTQILGDQLYLSTEDAWSKPLPSPNELKFKFLLRGKSTMINEPFEEDIEKPKASFSKPRSASFDPKSAIDPYLGRLIALPSVKMTKDLENDLETLPCNGSASLSEVKIYEFNDEGTDIAPYTSKRLVKSYPMGIRQDSSNLAPMDSWRLGVQCAALNVQTADMYTDINHGLFRTNGHCGYVLKPKGLIDGLDLRKLSQIKMRLTIAIISGHYLPRPNDDNDIIDPYVAIQIFGTSEDIKDENSLKNKLGYKIVRTKTIKDNGFNPVWNETFSFTLRCPEIAILRLFVMDYDLMDADDFVGEFSIPVISIRPGYSIIRLRTGEEHRKEDEAASLFVKIDIQEFTENGKA